MQVSDPVDPETRPVLLSSVVAVLAVALGAALLEPTGPVPLALGLAVLGVAALVAGSRRVAVGHTVTGVPWIAVGLLLVAAAFGLLVRDGSPVLLVQALPGVAGVVLLGLGLVPFRGGSRALVRGGASLVVVAVIAAAILGDAPPLSLLGATAAAIVAWDAGEYAIGLGAQVGRRATTTRAELVHVWWTLVVAAVAVAAGTAVRAVDAPALPLASFLGLLVALLILVWALRS